MTADPFAALRRPIVPARPDPRVAIALRRRLEEELDMIDVQAAPAAVRYPAMVHIGVPDADRAIRFFGSLLGWEAERVEFDDGIRHYVTNASGPRPVLVAQPGAPAFRLGFEVDDTREARELVTALGGTVDAAEIADDGGGWLEASDPAGVPLVLWRPGEAHPHDPPTAPATGNLLYLVVDVPDAAPALRFYGGLAGWPFRSEDDEYPDYHHVEEHIQPLAAGIQGSAASAGVRLFFTVADLDAAESAVVELGGAVVGDRFEWGPMTAVPCTDDQGTALVLAVLRGR